MTSAAIARRMTLAAAVFACAAAIVVLLGWILDEPRATGLWLGLPPMVPNTALALLLSGAALWTLAPGDAGTARRRGAQAAALAAGLIGAATLVEYLAGIPRGIDWLVMSAPTGSSHPRRPSPYTAVALICVAGGLLTLDRFRNRILRPSDFFSLSTLGVGILTLAGYGFGIEYFYTLPSLSRAIGVSVPTGATLIVLGLGMLAARPETGLASIVCSPRLGGYMARRLLAGALLLVPLLAGAAIAGQRAGFYPATGSVVFTMASALTVVVASVLWTASKLNAVDARRAAIEEQLRMLITHASDAIFVADLGGRYTSVNDAACRLLGFTREEFLGKGILDLLAPGDEERLLASKQRLLRGEAEVAEWRLRRKDGTFLPVEVSAKILPNGQWLGMARDATARREQSRRRFAAALESAANAMVVIDEAGAIVFANKQAEALFGYSLNELIGEKVERLVPEPYRSAHAGHRARFSKESEPHRAMGAGRDIKARRKDGSEVPVEVGLTRVALDEHPLVVASVVDISERQRAERALKDSEARLRSTVAELEAYSYTISHNLRAPLRAISGYAALVERKLAASGTDAESSLMIRRIKEAGHRLDRLVKDLLAYSAVSQVDPRLEEVDLDELLAVEAGHYPEIAPGDFVIHGPLGRVRGQPSLLLQAVSNLLRNAASSVPENRRARIEVRSELKAGGIRRLVIEDNGARISEELLGRVFEPFELGHGSEPPGIGLAIVKRAVERMGGRVGAEPVPEAGSRFWFELAEA